MRSNIATSEFFVGLPGLGQTLSKSSLSPDSAISRRTSEKAKLVRPFTLCRRSGSAFRPRINPSDRCRHQTKLQMVSHGLSITAQTCPATMSCINYYGIIANYKSLGSFVYRVTQTLFKLLNRRSQRKSYNCEGFNALVKNFGIVKPRICHAF